MSTCDKCFHWTQREPNWGSCDNRNGIAITENRGKLLTHRSFSCIAFSARLTFQRPAEPVPVSSQAFSQKAEEKDKAVSAKPKYKLVEQQSTNVWDQGGATTPVKH